MESIRIDAGLIRLAINDDPERVIRFNPSDVAFAERFYTLMREFEGKLVEYEAQAKALDEGAKDLDERGLPANLGNSIAFMRETCAYLHERIDYLFGAGTSEKVFEGVLNLEMIGQFFEGITPFIEKTRSERMARYAPAKPSRRVMK